MCFNCLIVYKVGNSDWLTQVIEYNDLEKDEISTILIVFLGYSQGMGVGELGMPPGMGGAMVVLYCEGFFLI